MIETDVISAWGIRVDLISVHGSELTRFRLAVEMTWFRVWIEFSFVFMSGWTKNWLVSRVRSKLILLQCWSKLPWFCVEGRNDLKDRNWLVLVRGSKWTLFLCAYQKLLVSSVRIEVDLFFVMVFEIDLISARGIELHVISVYGWSWFGCCVGGRNPHVTCMMAANHLFLWRALKLKKKIVRQLRPKPNFVFIQNMRTMFTTKKKEMVVGNWHSLRKT